MNIDKFLKEGKNIVIELDDEVEYLLGEDSIEALRREEGLVPVTRLIDGAKRLISIDRIEKSFADPENIDYLDKK